MSIFYARYKQRRHMGNHWSSDISISDLSREELLQLVEQICRNQDVDIVTQTRWHDMSVEQLRTIVVLLDDEMLDLLDARRQRPVTTSPYAPCNLLKSMYDWTRRAPNGREPQGQREITSHQRTQIAAAYLASLTPAQRLELEEEQREEVEWQEEWEEDEEWQEEWEEDGRFLDDDGMVERRARWEEEEQAERRARLQEVEDGPIANFRRLGVPWAGVEGEEDFLIRFAVDMHRLIPNLPGPRLEVVSGLSSSFLRRYLDHMYVRVQRWDDFQVWRHLRRLDMAEDPETAVQQFQRVLAGTAPVDSASERELWDDWRPRNMEAMDDLWRRFRRYALIRNLREIDGRIRVENGWYDWTDFQIWRHFRRRALLEDPDQVMVQFIRLQEGVPVVDEEEELQLFNEFARNEEAMNTLAGTFGRTDGGPRYE
jgi:hypothetical protein